MKRLLAGLLLILLASSQLGEAVSVWGSSTDESVVSLWTDYSTTYMAHKDSIDMLIIGDPSGTSSLSRFTKGGVVYTILSSKFTNATLESVKNNYAGKNNIQIPIHGAAMVAGYNLPTIGPGDPKLVLSGEVLALIYAGEIVQWNDARIAQLNTELAASNKLPAQPILLAAFPDATADITQVFGLMMCNFSSVFQDQYELAGGNVTSLPPRAAGRMTIGTSHRTQAQFVTANQYSLAYMGLQYAVRYSVTYADMVNKANATVSASPASVQSAMEAMSDLLQPGYLTIDLTDAPLAASWPMSYLLYATINTNLTNPTTGCPSVKELLNILLWTQTNTAAVKLLDNYQLSILPIPYIRAMISAFPSIKCNSRTSFSVAAVMGIGTAQNIYGSWADERSSTGETFQYYNADSQVGINDIQQQLTDFAAIDVELTEEQRQSLPDVAVIPMVAYAIAPAYSVDVFAYGALRFDYEALADIFLGNIRKWNDSRLQELNVNLTQYLPNEDICVIYQSSPSIVTYIYTTVLAANVPRFAEAIQPGMQVTFPNVNPCSQAVEGNPMVPVDHFSVPNSIGMWIVPDIIPSLYAGPAYMVKNESRAGPQPARDIIKTLQEYDNPLPADEGIIKLEGKGNTSWPFVVGSALMVPTNLDQNCAASQALLDMVWWTQTDIDAIEMADNYGMAVAAANPALKRRILNTLASVKCNGVATFSMAGCVYNGTFCSDRGECMSGVCACDEAYEGQYCESLKSSDDSLTIGEVLGITLGVLLPLICCMLIIVPLVVVAIVLGIVRLTKRKPEWEINPDEIDVGEPLGMGGFGSVYKARWRGTDVAVKMLPSHNPSKEMIKNFRDEIHVMMALRHPNVVLFMAASTRAERMCLVMEFMALGSLFDVLHNELIPEIPFALKIKLAYQAAKGMHFLHSSGIVHRDLKSLNLLLDNKWNVKVSDFGLTKLKQEIKTGKEGNEGLGSIPWTAPEVLNDQQNLDYILADVYSFGIILWELLTRSQPYPGLSPAAVAVAVIRDDARPELPAEGSCIVTPEYDELMKSCWHADPSIRPTFLEIVTRLGAMTGEMSSSSQGATSSSHSSAYHPHSQGSSSKLKTRKGRSASKASSITGGSSNSSAASSLFGGYGTNTAMMNVVGASSGGQPFRIPPPMGDQISIVFSDITSAASLWEHNPEAMKDATLTHNQLLRSLLVRHRGYEVRSTKERNTGEGSFCMVFQEASDAIEWCMASQKALLDAEWPAALLKHPGAAEEWGDVDDKVLFRGLRVRMGIHIGEPRVGKDPTTRRMDYYGSPVNFAASITAMAHGGQIVISEAVRAKLASLEKQPRVVDLGSFEMPAAPNGVGRLFEVKVEGLQGRFFGGVTGGQRREDGASSADDASLQDSQGDNDERNIQTAVGEGLANEDRYLTSANLCRWVIGYDEVKMGKQIGMGSYGVVYKGTWKGVDVAVKRFIKQNLDERRLLEFRAEMAFLSELHHPNIVLFIGACVRMPNLCIVTEFVKQGCLKAILANRSIKLPWEQRLRMLKSAALGVNYLHSLNPCIIHRDLKPSNLLVDENWNVKIADFGFARIKEENTTMTRCGTPCWTAPEVIRGEKYTEKCDVYSFGIIMWEMLTRKQPFAGRNFMGVSLDVLEGRRPQLPSDCPDSFRKMIERCWHAKAEKRPSMEDLLGFFSSLIGETSIGLDAV